ncbi:RHS repeat-associated core domain-containing protein [Niveispirillum sp. BGYR6]|uniref:RHS repeat domain-containing protein n=1 Tax=Niveispirillum sp. BGYR6 TaxID=2971249 RepID=UPI0022B97384|nr:RHS repeat-associated core domain-containing protein [Niveispirillum sp. BGYR6]
MRRGGAVSFSRAYGYDGADALVAIEDAKRGVRRYRYDACDRLLAVEGTNPESFVPDPAGNILASGADAGFCGGEAKGDRLLVHGDAKFQYDAWGNRVREWRAAGGAVSLTYRYDASNRLVAVERQDRRGRTLARYGYNAFGRRLWKQTAHLPPASANDDAPSPGGDASGLVWQRTDFLWDGDVLLGESAAHAPDAPSPDPLAIVYLHEPGSFRPLAQLRRNGGADQRPQVYHYHLDHLGTPQELTNDNGELVWQAEYRAWGALAKLHVAEVENPLRFQGQYHDAETGLHYNRHRYYAPNEGCFTTQDPIRLAGGSNLAAYAPNPVEWVDPLGLSCGVGKTGKADFYVNSKGETLPSTGYRYMRYQNDDGTVNKYVQGTIDTKSAPGGYFGFGDYKNGSAARDAFQIKGPEHGESWSDARLKGTFDTLQLFDKNTGSVNARVPFDMGNHGLNPEPFTSYYPEYGKGGAEQLITENRLLFDKVEIIPE